MHDRSRRAVIAGGGACAALMARTGTAVAQPPADALQAWLAAHASPIRSIDPADEDFSDLEPLAAAIGPARVVQLGEPSHGAGASFAAKVRLIKFLHQRMGFEVVVWESGLYDVALTQAGLRAGEDAATAARRGVFALWSTAQEAAPLFAYAKASQASPLPLDMAGFDIQVTARGSVERFAADLRTFVRTLHDPTTRDRAAGLADRAIAARERLYAQMQAGDLKALQDAADGLLATMRTQRAAFEAAHGDRTVAFMAHAIANMRADGVNRYNAHLSPAPNVERENRRDALNAANLRWLIEDRYRGRKLVVWAHNAHVMNAYYDADFRRVHLDARPDRMKPDGVFLAEWLKDDLYTIGFTAYEGSDGFATGGPVSPVAPAPDGSLESRLHALGRPYLFLDFRALDHAAGHPLRQPQSMRIPKYEANTLPDLTKAYDAVFYLDRMTPATRAPQAA